MTEEKGMPAYEYLKTFSNSQLLNAYENALLMNPNGEGFQTIEAEMSLRFAYYACAGVIPMDDKPEYE